MGFGGGFLGMGLVEAIIGFFVILGVFSAVRQRLTPNRLVLRSYRIDFGPQHAASDVNGHALSDVATGLLGDEPVFAAIIGRPAGLTNFIREGMGLSKRFEFALTDRQAILRMGSLSSHELQCSKLKGLNSAMVAQRRLHPLILFVQFLIVTAVINYAFIMLFGESAGIGLSLLIFLGFVVYWFICKVTVIEFFEGGQKHIAFTIYPAMLERITGQTGLDMPQYDANRLVQLFNSLKDSQPGKPLAASVAPPPPPPAVIVPTAAPVAAPPPPKPAPRKAADPVAAYCSACGTANEPGARFCGECGTAM